MAKESKLEVPDLDEILEILDVFDKSDLEELRLEVGGLKLVAAKSSGSGVCRSIETEPASKPAPAAPAPPQEAAEAAPEVSVSPAPPPIISAEEEGLIEVKAPLLGIFYRAPKPGAPPFVDLGSYVSEEDTVALIEVMKLFNAVKAGVQGRVVQICAENNQMVEYNQVLFIIDTKASPNS